MKTFVLTAIPVGLLLAALGSYCVAADEEAPARMWEQAPLKGQRGSIVGLAFSSNGKTLISAGSGDGTVRLWDMASSKNTDTFHHMLKDSVQHLHGMAVSPDGKTVTSYSYLDNTIRLWDVTRCEHVGTLKGGKLIHWVVFSADGKTLVAVEDRQVRLWSVEKKEEIGVRKMEFSMRPVTAYGSVKRPLLAMDGPWRRRSPYPFTFVDAVTGESVITCESQSRNEYLRCALDRDETMVASSSDQTVRIWDRKTGKHKATFEAPPAALGPLAFSPDGNILVCCYSRTAHIPRGNGDGFLIYEVSSGKVLEEIEVHRGGVIAMAFSPDGKLLATGGYESLIRLWTVPAAWRKKGK